MKKQNGELSQLENNNLSQVLEADGYLRQRLSPRPSSPAYLHLVDLREALDFHKPSEKISIFDYGLCRLPYRSLFPNSKYFRADFTPCDGLDFLLPADSSVPASDSPFDVILSTQVLEHAPEPAIM